MCIETLCLCLMEQTLQSIEWKRTDDLIGIETFKYEVSVLTKVHHRNLVVLLGYCIEGEEKLLVYQFMHERPLNKHLYHLFINQKS